MLLHEFGLFHYDFSSSLIALADLDTHFLEKDKQLIANDTAHHLCIGSQSGSLNYYVFVNFVCKDVHVDTFALSREKLFVFEHHYPIFWTD